MSIIESLQGRGRPNGTPQVRRAAIGSGIGAAIEVYDFIGFGTAAALYLGAAFFPGSDPAVAILYSFLTLGIGFGVRPIGGIIAGYLGDRIGRRPMLVGSIMVMGIGSVVMGLLPTYATIGVWAPVLLVLTRVVQGLAFGAEWGGAVLMTYEHAPLDKKGRFTGIMHAGFALGTLLASLAFLASAPLGNDWSWRIPMLGSVVLVVIGLIIRATVSESPAFSDVRETGHRSKNPLGDVFRKHTGLLILGIALRLAEPASYGIGVTYIAAYLQSHNLVSNTTTLVGLLIASVLGIFTTPMWAMLTDRIGRRPVFLGAIVFGIVIAIPLFLMANTGNPFLVALIMICAFPVLMLGLVAAEGTILPEMFRPEIRFTGASMSYQLSAAIAGFVPFIASAMYLWLGWMGPAILLMVICAISGTAVLILKESWSPAHRAEAAKLMAAEGTAASVVPAAV